MTLKFYYRPQSWWKIAVMPWTLTSVSILKFFSFFLLTSLLSGPSPGCPQGIAKRGRYGAFLMEELDLLADIVRTMSSDLKIPVTCKTRIYKDFNRTIRLCETLTNAGASLLTIHGRTREEKKQMIRRTPSLLSSALLPLLSSSHRLAHRGSRLDHSPKDKSALCQLRNPHHLQRRHRQHGRLLFLSPAHWS
jgi:hypothetical protein